MIGSGELTEKRRMCGDAREEVARNAPRAGSNRRQ